MQTKEFLELLQAHPEHELAFATPGGGRVPAHFHITEVGHLAKTFIDCGGKRHTSEACLLQVWVANDTDHRLTGSKLLGIFGRAATVLPNRELPVEIEFEAPVLTQLPVTHCEVLETTLLFHTAIKRTDCLAKELCMPDFTLPAIPGTAGCRPGSGCC